MVAHEKRNSAQLFCAVPTRNDLALSSLLFPAQPTQKLEYPRCPLRRGEGTAWDENFCTKNIAAGGQDDRPPWDEKPCSMEKSHNFRGIVYTFVTFSEN